MLLFIATLKLNMAHGTDDIDRTVLELLWRHCTVGCALVDEEGKFLRVNDRLCEILEYTSAEMADMTYQEITHPKDVAPDTIMADRVARGENTHYRMLKTYLKKSGYPVQVELVVWPIRTEDGEFDYFLSQIVPRINVFNAQHAQGLDTGVNVDGALLLANFLKGNKKVVATIVAIMAATAALLSAVTQQIMAGNVFN